jgi:hypothetical protein
VGVDVLTTYHMEPVPYFALAAAARERGMLVGGEVTAATLAAAPDSGARLLDGLQSLPAACFGDSASASVEKCRPIAEQFRRNGTWWVPTLTSSDPQQRLGREVSSNAEQPLVYYQRRFYEIRLDEKTQRYLSDAAGRCCPRFWLDSLPLGAGNWLNDPETTVLPDSFLSAVRGADLPIVAGTNRWGTHDIPMRYLPPGFALQVELALYTAGGLTPLAALQTATLNPAKLLHATDSLGTVAAGKLADLILLDANPLKDITNVTTIRAVVANGRYFDRAALDKMLADARDVFRWR